METIIQLVEQTIWVYLTIPLLLAISLMFTFYLKGPQFRLGKMLAALTKKTPGSPVSPTQSLALALAARVGVGSLGGVALAIAIGGPGAIFWMWISALLTASASFAESTLAQMFKRKDREGFFGGPAYYIQDGLKNRPLAVTYAIMIILTYTLGFSAVQTNTIAASFHNTLAIPPLATGMALTALTASIIFGGATLITKMAGKVVPIIAIFYLGMGLIVMFTRFEFIPEFFRLIFTGAFQPAPLMGGVGGSVIFTVMTGLKRGIFSNEAGLGSGAHPAAITDSEHATEQGYIQAFGVYLTTLVVTTVTAFLILVTDAHHLVATGGTGIELTQFAMNSLFGNTGTYLLALSIFFFGFTTIPTAYFYGESNMKFLFKKRWTLTILRWAVLLAVFFSSFTSARLIFSLADIGTGLTAIINLIALQLLSKKLWAYIRPEKGLKTTGKNRRQFPSF